MSTVTRFPSRPLLEADVSALNQDDRLHVVPYGGVPERDGVRIYAVKIATSETAHALGFDESRGRWARLGTVGAGDLASADEELDALLEDWAEDRYGGEFDVLKPA